MADVARTIAIIKENLRRELEASHTYRSLAEREKDTKKKSILLKMAVMETRHAEKWASELRRLGEAVPQLEEGAEARIRQDVAKKDPLQLVSEMEEIEDAHAEEYRRQVAALGQERYQEIIDAIARDEETHAAWLGEMRGQRQRQPKSRLDSILHREKWHVSTGSWLGDAVYGVNDGLGAVFGIVSGVAGYTGGSHFVLISGLAGMLASALSMGSGAYLATKSEREVYDAEMSRESKEIMESPEEEIEELSLFYQLKGLSEEEADKIARHMAEKPDEFLRALAHEELGLSQSNFPNPTTSAASAAISTAVGALVPVIPFFFLSGLPAILVAAGISLIAHFAVGAAKSLFTVRPWWASGLEMTVVGAIEAAVTYGIGVGFAHIH